MVLHNKRIKPTFIDQVPSEFFLPDQIFDQIEMKLFNLIDVNFRQ